MPNKSESKTKMDAKRNEKCTPSTLIVNDLKSASIKTGAQLTEDKPKRNLFVRSVKKLTRALTPPKDNLATDSSLQLASVNVTHNNISEGKSQWEEPSFSQGIDDCSCEVKTLECYKNINGGQTPFQGTEIHPSVKETEEVTDTSSAKLSQGVKSDNICCTYAPPSDFNIVSAKPMHLHPLAGSIRRSLKPIGHQTTRSTGNTSAQDALFWTDGENPLDEHIGYEGARCGSISTRSALLNTDQQTLADSSHQNISCPDSPGEKRKDDVSDMGSHSKSGSISSILIRKLSSKNSSFIHRKRNSSKCRKCNLLDFQDCEPREVKSIIKFLKFRKVCFYIHFFVANKKCKYLLFAINLYPNIKLW